jgi:hypothetical protein
MSRKQIISLGAVAVVLVAVIGLSMASYAAQDDGFKQENHPRFNSEEWQERKVEMEAKREVVIAAVESGDYQAWLAAVGADSKLAEIVSEDEFPRLLEAHNLMQQARENMEQARQIKEEIGFPAKEGKFREGKKGFQPGMMGQGMGLGNQ